MKAPPVFFGWKVVAAAFVVAVFAWGIGFYGPAVFLSTLHRDRGWPVSAISAAITAHFLFSAVMVANLADAHRQFGIVAVTRAGAVCTALGLAGWGLATSPWHLFAAALFTGAGWATTSAAAINAMISPWFERRRASALSHAFNGASIGGVVFTPLWVVLIDRLGFTAAVSAVGAAMAAIVWLLAGRYLRSTPEALDLALDGDPLRTAVAPVRQQARRPTSRAALVRDRRFATLSAAFALGLFAQIGLVAHLVARLAPVLGAGGAAGAVSLAAACAMVGRMSLGALLGDADRRVASAANFAIQACGAALLALGDGPLALLAGCILFGLGIGNLISLPPLVAQAEFDRADVGQVVGLVSAVNQAVLAFAPAIFGMLLDTTGDYVAPFLLAMALQLVAGAVVLSGRSRIRR